MSQDSPTPDRRVAMLRLLDVFRRRADLQQAFPEVCSRDYGRLVEWAAGVVERKWEDSDYETLKPFGDRYRHLASLTRHMTCMETQGIPIPPRDLRLRVHGSEDENAFLRVGKTCSQNIRDSLVEHCGKGLFSFKRVLDFGCGCGRTLRWFHDHPPACRLFGTDIDDEAITWCKANMPFAEFDVNGTSPPLARPSATFDMIYAISVLTHLSEREQAEWLLELRRIAKPGAFLILTTHGGRAAELAKLDQEKLSELRRLGFLFFSSPLSEGLPVEFRQKSVSFQTRDQVFRSWTRIFDIVAYLDHGLNNHQDLVVLKKMA